MLIRNYVIPYVPFAIQGVIMAVDEFHCHQKRELRGWERIGHPADTLVFASCFAFLYFAEPSSVSRYSYLALSIFSCLMITKDEWQHKDLCSGFENWLHSLLFIMHPITLIWCGWMWWRQKGEYPILVMFGLTVGFFVYQLIYWNVWRRDRQ